MEYKNLNPLNKITKIIKRGITPKYTANKRINVINQRCIRDGRIDFSPVRFHDDSKKIQEDKILQNYDVLVNSTGVGTLGRVAQFKNISDKIYTVDSHVTILRPIEEIDKLYFGYAIKEKEPFIASMGEGSTGQTELSRVRLGEEVFINVPSLDKQKKIALSLFSIDKKIEVNNKIIANLEEQAQAIFKSWFVDFEPFQNGNFVESELGMIPEGWKVREISDLVTYNKRGFSPKYIENGTGIPVINQRCVRDNKIIEEAVQYHDINKKKVPKDKYYEPFDVLINSMGVGTLGRVSQVSKLSERRIVHSCITILRAKNSIIKPSIFGQMMIYNQKLFESMGQGTTGQTSLKNKEIDKLKFVIAPINTQNNIDGFFNYFLEFRDSLLDENKRLAEIRDALLPKLMSGEIDVSNIKIKGEEVKNE